MQEPCQANEYQSAHADLLLTSYTGFLNKPLISIVKSSKSVSQILFEAPFGLVSHDTATTPLFNYANQTALRLFEMDWQGFTSMPSKNSAEPVNQEERQRLLDRVSQYGFIDDYRGIRISASGRRFWIENATVWNLLDDSGKYHGQAAVFHQWTMIT